MKKFFGIFAIAALSLVILTTGCQDDEPIVEFGPEISLLSVDPIDQSLYFDTDFSIAPGSVVPMGIEVDRGTATLKSLRVLVDGTALSTDRFQLFDLRNGGSAITVNNPILLSAGYPEGLAWRILLTVQSDISVKDYTIEVIDENDRSASVTVEVTTFDPGTPIDMTLEGILLNQAGPAGTGGLNLNTGVGTGSMDAAAHIRDMGIDLSLPAATNWRRQIAGVNGSVIRKPDATLLPEGFTFASITKKEEIEGIFNTGIALPNDSGNVSAVVNVGDYFVVQNGARFYFLEVKEVNVTTNNNADNYVFDIKY